MANHHYVPQFYLKRFCDPTAPENQEPYLWVSARGGTEWKKRAPKNVAAKPNLYAVPSKDGSDQMVEKMFGAIESSVAEIYRRRFDIYDEPHGRDEREMFATFVALFAIRSPFYRRNIAKFSEDLAQMSLRMMASRPEAVEHAFKKMEAETGEKAKLTVKEYQDAVLGEKFKLEAAPHFITAMSLQQVETFARIIYAMQWRFLIAPGGGFFATADSPAHWQDLTPRPPMFRGHGLAMKNVEVVLPLSRRFCFLARWNRATGVVLATPAQVREITNRTISWSDAEVYSPVPFKKVLFGENFSRPLYPLLANPEPGFVRPPASLVLPRENLRVDVAGESPDQDA